MPTLTIDLNVPQGWHELTDKQLRYVFRLLATGHDGDAVKTFCLLRWSGIKVIGRQDGGAFLLKKGRRFFEVRPLQIAEHLPSLAWLDELPPLPVRPRKFGRRKALPADFAGVAFETYLAVENLYQGFLATRRDDLLDTLAALLYPGLNGPLSAADRTAVFYWAASLKELLARRYPDFFQPVAADGANLLGGTSPDVEAAMNAQIRALTKGDVTKEREILALDTHRALTELNAQAREYRELNSKLNANR